MHSDATVINLADRKPTAKSDRHCLVVTSGRADASPLKCVIEELEKLCRVEVSQQKPEDTNPADLIFYSLASMAVKPDIVVLLGDRYESLFVAAGAAYHRIPIAHIHGGESTYGAIDDSMRHAISKLSHLHFVANMDFHDVLQRMGERLVYVTGAPGIDNLVPYMEMERKPEKYFVCTYHPETLGEDQVHHLMDVLFEFPDYGVYWTGVNQDPGSDDITSVIRKGIVGRTDHHIVDWTLGEYLTHCRHAAAIIGNSSSGIIEAPYLEVPTVNIGKRQEGRPVGRSIYQDDELSIAELIKFALMHDPNHRPFDCLYGEPGASKKIAEIIATHPLEDILRKPWKI